jgi:acetylornithine deacetylase/succinyl-diaminopimelate desuccinylase-like protein
MSNIENALKYAQTNRSRFMDSLGRFLTIPSISTDPDRRNDIIAAADWVADYLRNLGVDQVDLFPPDSHPIVYGEYLQAGPDAPTVLIYGHYDVQPAEPLSEWNSDPFRPVVHGENIYARGASDMKGQVMATLFAIEAIMKTTTFPVNLKFMIEGEEEIGSPHLAQFIEAYSSMLACEFCLNTDTGMIAPSLPTITYTLRGLAYYELQVTGPSQDLHSGLYGGVVHNPAQALCELIAGMHDKSGRITLPGFYEDVLEVEDDEASELARLPMDESFYKERTGVSELWGEPDFAPVQRIGARPTLEVNGIFSGFTGTGAKTVIPSIATAKLSCRLVANQDPKKIEGYMSAYLREHAPATISWQLRELTTSPPSLSNHRSTWVQALVIALETVWGVRPTFKREGGSVPVVADLQRLLGVDSVNSGFGLPDDNLHGPNEKLHLPTFYKGIDALIYFFFNLG